MYSFINLTNIPARFFGHGFRAIDQIESQQNLKYVGSPLHDFLFKFPCEISNSLRNRSILNAIKARYINLFRKSYL